MIARVVLSLVISGFLLLSLLTLYLAVDLPDEQQSLEIPLVQVVGDETEEHGQRLVVPGRDGLAVLSGKISPVLSEKTPILILNVKYQESVDELLFFWRKSDGGGKVETLSLPAGPGKLHISLMNNPAWNGLISEVGLVVYGDDSGRISVDSIALRSADAGLLLRSEIDKILTIQPWDQRTINFKRIEGYYFSLLPVICLWLILAVIILRILRHDIRKYFVFALVFGWIVFDLRWLWEKYSQLEILENQVVQLSGDNVLKVDGDIYNDVERIKRELLPAEPARIQIIKSGSSNDYRRLKAQYFLLPHSVYNYGSRPVWDQLKPGDWVLVMGEIPGLVYDEKKGLILRRNQLDAELMDVSKLGKLYRIN